MIYLFNNNEEMIRIIPNSAIKRMYQTQTLTDENYISDRLGVEIQALNDEELSELEYMAIDDIENPQRFHYYFIVKETTEHQITSLTGVQSGIEELRKTPVYDMRPTNLSPKLIADRLLEGTNWQAGYTTDDVGTISTNFYYTDVFSALKKMCMAFGIEMQFFVEITTNRIGARYIEFRKRTGKSVGKRVVYGHNALKIVKEVEKTNTITALIGRGKGVQVSESDEGNVGYGRKIGFENVEWNTSSGAPVDKPLGQEFVEIPELTLQYGIKNSNGTVRPKIGFVEFQDEESETRLIDRTYNALLELSRPQVLLETSSVYLPDTGIGDTVNVVRHDRDLRYQTRVFEITWDRLANQAVGMKLGDRLGESENKRISRISNQVSGNISTELSSTIEELADRLTSADGKNTNWYTDYDPMENPETMGLVRVNDNWYQPDPEYEGEFILKQWNGEMWIEILRTSGNQELVRRFEEIEQQAEELTKDIEASDQKATEAKEEAGLAKTASEAFGLIAQETVEKMMGVEGRLSLNLLDLTKVANEHFTNPSNPNIRNYTFEGKPNTKYTLSTNMPMNDSYYDLFFDAPTLNPSSSTNGVGVDEPRTVTTDDTGVVHIGFRADDDAEKYTKLQDVIGGRYWVILSEGSKALELSDSYATNQISELSQTVATVESNASEALAKASEVETQAGQAVIDAQTAMGNAQTALGKADGAESTVNTLSKEVDTIEGMVKLKAEQTEVDTLSGTVSTQGTAISQNATSIASKAEQTEVDTVSGLVSTNSTTLEQHAKEISARLTESQVDGLVDAKGYSTVTYVDTQLSTTADGITAELSRVEGLSIKNLLTDRFFSKGLDGWTSVHAEVSVTRINGRMRVGVSGANETTTDRRIYNSLPLTKDRVYNFSFKFIGRSDGFVEVGQFNGERIRFERINGEKVISGSFRSNGSTLSIYFPRIGTMEFTDMMVYESAGATSTDIANINLRADGFDVAFTNLNNDLEDNYATKSYTNTQISTKAGEISQSLSELEGRLGLNLLDITKLANENLPNTSNPNILNYMFEGKPNTKYTLNTNMPMNGSNYDLFFDAPTLNPSSAINGVSVGAPRTVTTDDTGITYIGFRPAGWSENSSDIGDIVGGRYWVTLSEGSKALELADNYATKRINELNQTVNGWENTISYVNDNTTKINQTISTVDTYTQTLGTNGEKIGQLVLSDSAFQTTIGEYSRAKQLLPNGDFTNGTSGWTFDGNSSMTYDSVNKQLRMNYVQLAGESRIYTSFTFMAGVTYTVKIRAKTLSTGKLSIGSPGDLSEITLSQDFGIYTVSTRPSSPYSLSIYKLNSDGSAIIDFVQVYEEGAVSTKQISDIKQTADGIQALVGTTNDSVARAVMTSSLWETEVSKVIDSELEQEYETVEGEVPFYEYTPNPTTTLLEGDRSMAIYLPLNADTAMDGKRVVIDVQYEVKAGSKGNHASYIQYGDIKSSEPLLYSSLTNVKYHLYIPPGTAKGNIMDLHTNIVNPGNFTWGDITKITVSTVEKTQVPIEGTNTGAISSKITQLYDMINLSVLGKEGALNRIAMGEEGIQIDGKLLHITAKTFIDDAVIKSAMIDTLDAGKITTGELNASLIRVVNLDAQSIQGNEAGFIKALFESAHSVVTITGDRISARRNDGTQSVAMTNRGLEILGPYGRTGSMQYGSDDRRDRPSLFFNWERNHDLFMGVVDPKTNLAPPTMVLRGAGNYGIEFHKLLMDGGTDYGIEIANGSTTNLGRNVVIYNQDRTGGIMIANGDISYLGPNGWRSLNTWTN